ncbi:hypothetical protein NP233_g6998 [Leucocoprinus birnbaumii]|uniref:mitogen-activated protein kinase kinase kinase n=1 Tax=Leucocoprinus birnbaumii TaxID=56174 RepID=A0AAD5YV16_9AGAR|nr:hypothetical protein NP233_g6998 [Leucocoprinus birnbaumii]
MSAQRRNRSTPLSPTEIAHVRELVLNISAQTDKASGSSPLGLQLLLDLRALLSCPVKAVFDAVIVLDEDRIQTFNNILDYALKEHLTELKERAHALTVLSRAVAATRIYPERLLVEPLKYNLEPKAWGGFGTVHQGINTSVCVKVIRVDTKPKSFGPWVKEVVLWAHASHPNLLPLLGIFFEQGDGTISKTCLVCPFMENGNLCEYAPRIPQQERFILLLDVADGLQFLHIMGIVHSDLKGQNVLITSKHRAVITDFGSSRTISTTTAATTTTASTYTLCYAAPEVSVGGEKATTMSDIWSFGCLIFQTLSRKPPYYQYSQMQVISALLQRDPPPRPGPINVSSKPDDSRTRFDSDSDSDEFSDEEKDEDWDPIADNAWSLILQCCASQPSERLVIPEIQQAIKAIQPAVLEWGRADSTAITLPLTWRPLCGAVALYRYDASPDDSNELSFDKGEILQIDNMDGKWWMATKADGTQGIAPSNYLKLL